MSVPVPYQVIADPKQTVTPAFQQWMNAVSSASGSSGTVTDVTASDDGNVTLTVTDATSTPNIAGALADTAVTPGAYTNADITVDQQGRITAAADGGASSPLTTKGDIYGFSTVDARIPVGSNGNALLADSTQTLGVKWGTVSATVTMLQTLIGGAK